MPAPHTIPITATGVVNLMNADPDFSGNLIVEIKTVSGTFSLTPQVKMTDGSGTYYNKAYTTWPTEVSNTAGTAITADGIYKLLVDGCIGALNVTAIAGSITVYVRPLVG